jgi:N6-adenosine-specific RNA methylase IME4
MSAVKFHRLANIFPLLEGAAFDELVADIQANGQREPITILDGEILDGRNRYRACRATGIKPQAVDFRPDVDGAPLAFVISKNLKRRHLDESQRAMAGARIEMLRHGGDRKPQDANLQVVRRDDIAKQLNVSPRSIASAAVVRDKATPRIVQAVDRGKLSISQAAIAAKLSTEQQERIAEEAEAGRTDAARAVIKRETRAAKVEALGAKQRAMPEQQYGVILLDWPRKAWAWSEETGFDRSPDNHYVTQDFRWAIDVLALMIRKLAAPDSMLVMWSTAASLIDDIEIMTEAGFCALRPRGDDGRLLRDEAGEPLVAISPGGGTYRSHQVWDKQSLGMGRWFRDRHELLLIGVRGNIPCPAPGTQGPSIFSERRSEHSAKPDFVAKEIELLWSHLPKIELFRRGAPRPGWDAWGADCDQPESPHDPETAEIGEAAE